MYRVLSLGLMVMLASETGCAQSETSSGEKLASVYDEPGVPVEAAVKRFTSEHLMFPVRLESESGVIDTGSVWGHSSPCLEDLNSDGLPDLILGDFSGKFQVYQNAGTSEAPKLKAPKVLKAGDVDAEVWIYCCIGSQARFGDLNGDGIRDMISNSYDPGHCYLFMGQGDGKFASREELKDRNGIPIRSKPTQTQNYESFGSFFELVDWESDGDLDLLIGCFDGHLMLRLNEGTTREAVFAADNIRIDCGGAPVKVKAHLCPDVADWDLDGLWDIVAGSDDGSVTWFRNTGTMTQPSFAEGEQLVPPHEGTGYEYLIWHQGEILPGIRSQVEVADWNADGKPDLLVGDFFTSFHIRKDITESDRKVVADLLKIGSPSAKAFGKKMQELRDDFAKRYPGDAIFSEKADKEWSKEYKALRESPEAKAMEGEEKELAQNLKPFLASTRGDGDRLFDLAQSHGHLWLFLRKDTKASPVLPRTRTQ
ncbi:MAG: VCBS repeat-containing protein [Planctomyces sp.]|nr:VCBS repeat-containing protein [Planctomyces sp.]